jgi:nucleoside-diphosphate-sugar epimerase
MTKSYWCNKKVLVTGGAGFIGSYLVELLLDEGAKVSVIDNLSSGRLENLSGVSNVITFFQNDMRNLDFCRAAAAGKDVVLNLASPVFGIEYSSTHHGKMLTDVVQIGFNALRAAYLEGVKRFLVVSSSCVYPDDAKIPTPESEGTRGVPEQVNAGYGWGKRMVELQAQYYAQEYGMEIAIARPFNAYGHREPFELNKANVMPSLICKVLRGDNPVIVWGSGNQTRSFIHGKDFAMGLKLITELYPAADPVNLGHDRETSIRELAEQIVKITGKKNKLFFDTSKPEGAKRKSADVTKLRKITGGFVPQITLDEGLKEMIEYIEKEIARHSLQNKI